MIVQVSMGYEYPIMLDVGEIPVAMTLHESVDKAWGALFASPPGLVARPSRKVQLAPCRDVRASTSFAYESSDGRSIDCDQSLFGRYTSTTA